MLNFSTSGNMSGDLIYRSLCRLIAHVFSKLLLGHQIRKCHFYTTALGIKNKISSDGSDISVWLSTGWRKTPRFLWRTPA
jgi:hypothetical protein